MEEMTGKTIPKGYHVHHVDGDETNDRPSNLQLLTAADHNRVHHLGVKNPKKANRPNRKVTQALVDEVKRLRRFGYSQLQIGEIMGVHQTMVSKILAGKPLESRL